MWQVGGRVALHATTSSAAPRRPCALLHWLAESDPTRTRWDNPTWGRMCEVGAVPHS
jgi:hypothetical protein